MLRFILRRTLYAVPSLLGLLLVTFLLIRVVPADPAAALAGDNATLQQIADIRHQYGFDRPIAEQLLIYFGQILRLNSTAGTSLAMAASVAARAASCTELHRNRGTEGSNPLWTSS